MAFRPAVSRGLAFSKVATPGICPAAITASCFGFFDTLARKDLPGNRSRPGLHWLRFVVCRAGIAPTENLVCLEASPVFQRAHSLSSEGVVTGEGLFFGLLSCWQVVCHGLFVLNPNSTIRTFNDDTASLLRDDVGRIKLVLDLLRGIFAIVEESFMCAAQMLTFSIVVKIHPDYERMISEKLQDGYLSVRTICIFRALCG